jgi:hypothetical protein
MGHVLLWRGGGCSPQTATTSVDTDTVDAEFILSETWLVKVGAVNANAYCIPYTSAAAGSVNYTKFHENLSVSSNVISEHRPGWAIDSH